MQSTMCWLVRPGPLNWSCHPFVLFDFIFAESLCMFIDPLSSIIVSSTLISIVFPSFLIAVAAVFVLYALTAAFYRVSARETKVRALQTKSLRSLPRDIPSDSTLFCGRRQTPTSPSPCLDLQLYVPTGKKADS